MKDLKIELLEKDQNKELLNFINNYYNPDDKDLLVKELVSLYNSGNIDILSIFNATDLNHEINYFTLFNVLQEVIPQLNANVEKVIVCVNKLNLCTMRDYSNFMNINAFIKFLQNENERVEASLNFIKESNDYTFLLAPILVEGWKMDSDTYYKEIQYLLKSGEIEKIVQGLLTLKNLDYSKNEDIKKETYEILRNHEIHLNDDELLNVAIDVYFYICQNTDKDMYSFLGFVKEIKDYIGEKTNIALSKILFQYSNDLSFDSIVDIIQYIKIDQKSYNILQNIDHLIDSLFRKKKTREAIEILEILILNPENKIDLECFPHLNKSLYHYNDHYEALSTLITKWFLSRNAYLCKSAGKALSLNGFHNPPIEINLQKNINIDSECMYLAKKIIGWAYLCPLTMISCLISLLEYISINSNAFFEDILFYPVMISYPGVILDYIDSRKAELPPHLQTIINNAKNEFDKYSKNITNGIDPIELRTSQNMKETYNRNFQQKMELLLEKSSEDSFVNLIASHITLLYGNKTISYIHNGKGESGIQRQEIPLTEHSITTESPSLMHLDPTSLNYMLEQFRIEGCTL